MRVLLCVSLLLLSSVGWSQVTFTNLSVTGKIGTLGGGVDVGYKFNDRFSARLGYSGFEFDFDEDVDGINYDGDLDISALSLLGDWYPVPLTGFRVTAGLMNNFSEVNAIGKSNSSGQFVIGGTTYAAADVGTLNSQVDFDGMAPYVGVGWRGGLLGNLNFDVDLGVLFTDPDSTITADGPISSDPTFQAELEQERADFEEDLDDFDMYPVLSIGLNYAF